jgi:hypothetical protein
MPADLVTTSEVAGIYNRVQEQQSKKIIDLWIKAEKKINPLLASFEAKSDDEGEGRGFITRFNLSTGTSVNPSFAIAQAKAASTTTGNSTIGGRWVSRAMTLEGVAMWTRKAMTAARKNGPGEVYDVIWQERESKIALMRHRLAVFAVEAGWGRVSTVVACTTTNLYFTCRPSEVNRFRKGDDIVFAASESSDLLKGSGRVWTVSGTRGNTVYLEAQAAPNAAYRPYDTDGVTAGDVVFWYGYRENSATPTKLCPDGILAWIPPGGVAAGETSFHGVDRRNNQDLSGYIIDTSSGTQLDHASAFIEMAAEATRVGTQIDAIYTSVDDMKILCRNKEMIKAIAQYEAGKYQVGFSGMGVAYGSDIIPIIQDAYLPQGYAWGGPWNSEDYGPKMKHVNQLINVDNADGNDFLRAANATAYEQRMYSETQNIFPAPGKYIVATNLPAS